MRKLKVEINKKNRSVHILRREGFSLVCVENSNLCEDHIIFYDDREKLLSHTTTFIAEDCDTYVIPQQFSILEYISIIGDKLFPERLPNVGETCTVCNQNTEPIECLLYSR